MNNLKSTKIALICILISMMTLLTTNAMSSEENNEICRQYAIESEIPDEELQDYMADCVNSLQNNDGEVDSTEHDNPSSSDTD
jgi:hypothetical protein